MQTKEGREAETPLMNAINLIRPYFEENRMTILLGLLCLIIVDILQLFIPRVIKWAVDDLAAMQIDSGGLSRYALYILVLGLLIGGFRFVWRRCLLGTARKTEEALRNKLFFHVQTLSAAYFDRTKTGDLMAHATNDIQQVRMATGMGMVALNDALVLGSAAIGFMIYINLELTLYVMIPMPFLVVGTRFFGKKMHARYRTVQSAFSDFTEGVRERFAGVRVIKVANAQAGEIQRVSDISEHYFNENIRLIKVTGSFFPLMLFLTNLSLAAVLFWGGRKAILFEITPGDFVAFISYLGLLTWPMMALGWVTNLIQRGRASLDRLNVIFGVMPEIADKKNALSISRFQRELFINDVSFSYQGDRGKVLSRVSVTLKKGRTLCVIGPPGSGKTTLLELLMRFYDIDSGTICIDGSDIRDLKISHLRSLMTYSPQEPFLFAGTIRDNIMFGAPGTSKGRLDEVVHLSALETTVMAFPDGYDTIVGEKGVILSGGQKQRVALARAFLNDADILVLDDPISQVDTRTGAEIIRAIQRISEDKTVIIASHRLSAVKHADQILVMEKGRIIESGNHEVLIKNNGYYAKTYRLQELEDAL